MQRQTEQQPQAPQRLGRFLRLLVGDTGEMKAVDEKRAAEGRAPAVRRAKEREVPREVVDLRAAEPGSRAAEPDLRAVEARVGELERGMRVLAETLRRSHGELAHSVQSLRVIARDEDRIGRSEVQRLIWEAIGPLSMSVERLADSIQDIPPALADADADAAAAAAADDQTPERAPATEGEPLASGLAAQQAAPAGDPPDGSWLDGTWAAGPRRGRNRQTPGAESHVAGDMPALPFEEPDGSDWFWGPSPSPSPDAT